MSDSSNIWFDCEKSTQRYEGLLKTYQNSITKKDDIIKEMEGQMHCLKRERMNLENENLKALREKDDIIKSMNNDYADLVRKQQKLQKEYDTKYGPLDRQMGVMVGRLGEAHEQITSLKSERADLLTKNATLDMHLREAHCGTKASNQEGYDGSCQNKIDNLRKEIDLLSDRLLAKEDELSTWKINAEIGATELTKELQQQVELLTKNISTEKVEREQEKLHFQDRITEMEREVADLGADLDLAKNLYSESKRLSDHNAKELDHQMSVEAKLRNDFCMFISRKDENRPEDQEVELKQEREQVAAELACLKKELKNSRSEAVLLENELRHCDSRNARFAKSVEKQFLPNSWERGLRSYPKKERASPNSQTGHRNSPEHYSKN